MVNNNAMKKIPTLTFILLMFSSCSELVHTQLKAPRLVVERDTLSADGTDNIILTATVENQLSTRQRLRFSTTNGELVMLPISTASRESDSSILVNPGVSDIRAILKASKVPDDHVILSASVGELASMQIVEFKRSCPDEIKVELLKSNLTVNETTDFNLVFLRNDARNISMNTRIDCAANENDVFEMSSTFYSDNSGKASGSIKGLVAGDFTITFSDRSGCGLADIVRTISIE